MMSAKAVAEEKEMEKLEHAAEEASEPEEINRSADAPREADDKPPRHWFVPYVVIAAVAGAGIFFLDWQEMIRASVVVKIQRYLIGIAGVALLLGVMKGVEFYVIGRCATRC